MHFKLAFFIITFIVCFVNVNAKLANNVIKPIVLLKNLEFNMESNNLTYIHEMAKDNNQQLNKTDGSRENNFRNKTKHYIRNKREEEEALVGNNKEENGGGGDDEDYFFPIYDYPNGTVYTNLTEEEFINWLKSIVAPKSWAWVLIFMHTLVFIVGLVGNILVCVAVYRNHTMRTVTNYFIVNLAVADFLVILFCLPPTVAWDVTMTWFFGITLCKIVLYLQVSNKKFFKALVFFDFFKHISSCYTRYSEINK